MSEESIKMLLIITQLSFAVTSDVRSYKVKNEMNLGFAVLGIIYNTLVEPEIHLSSSLLGLFAPFGILLPLYLLQMLGAGDIKLMCSIGALVGIRVVLWSMALTFLFGFFMALMIMVARKNFFARLKKLFHYLQSCFLSMRILPYYELNTNNDGKMHFTIPIALGTIVAGLL